MKLYQSIHGVGVILVSAAVLLVIPVRASAHLVTTGMGPVYDGIGHLLLTPEDLVPVIAVALYVGLCGKTAGRHTLFVLPAVWLAGGIVGLAVSGEMMKNVSILSFLVLGVLIAADVRLHDYLISLLVICLGGIHGFYNGSAMAGGPGLAGLVGISSAIFVIVAITAGCVVSIRHTWPRIAVRVIGSWIAAVGLLLFGWMMKGAG